MAVIKSRSRRLTVISGASMEAAAELGVRFGCLNAVCGRCATNVTSGLGNLSAPTPGEAAMGLEPGRRLLCQCRITKGTVGLDLD